MAIQTKLNGEAELTGYKTNIKFRNGLEKEIFHSDIMSVGWCDGVPVLKIENNLGKVDAYWKGIEPLEATDEYFKYPLSQESFNSLKQVTSI